MEEEEVLVPKPRTMALEGLHFGFRPNGDGEHVEEAICKICPEKMPIESANATTVKRCQQTHNPQQYA